MDDLCYHNYRRGVPTTVDLVGHAYKLGINLRYQGIPVTFPAKQRSNRSGSAWSPRPDPSVLNAGGVGNQSYSSIGSAKSLRQKPSVDSPVAAYIHNLVVPLSRDGNRAPHTPYSNTLRVRSAYTSHSYRNGGRTPSIQLTTPNSRVQSARRLRTHSQSSSQRERGTLAHATSSQSTLGSSAGHRVPQKSSQSLRFETEQTDMQKCRIRKRTSVVQPHRVDRMYFMTGSTLSAAPKHHVENEELVRLRELSRARQETLQQDRGVSNHRGDQYIPDHMRTETSDDPASSQTPVPSLKAASADSSTMREGAGGEEERREEEGMERRKEEINSVSEGPLSAGGREQGETAEEGVAEQLNELQLEDDNNSDGHQLQQQDEDEPLAADQQENEGENLESSTSQELVQENEEETVEASDA